MSIEKDIELLDLVQVVSGRTKKFAVFGKCKFSGIKLKNGSSSRGTPGVTVLHWLTLHGVIQQMREDLEPEVKQRPSLLGLVAGH